VEWNGMSLAHLGVGDHIKISFKQVKQTKEEGKEDRKMAEIEIG